MKILAFTLSFLMLFASANEALVYCNKQISPGAGAGFVPVTDNKSLLHTAPDTINYYSYSYSMSKEKLDTYIRSIGLNKKPLNLRNSKNIIYAQILNDDEYNTLKNKISLKQDVATKSSNVAKASNDGYISGMCAGGTKNNSIINALLFKALIDKNRNLSINIISSNLENNANQPFRLDANAVLPAEKSNKYIVISGTPNNNLIYGKLALINFTYITTKPKK